MCNYKEQKNWLQRRIKPVCIAPSAVRETSNYICVIWRIALADDLLIYIASTNQ